MNVRAKALALRDRFDALTLRERGMVAAAVLGALLFAWDSAVVRPMDARERAVRTQLESHVSGAADTESAGQLEAAAAQMNALLERERALEQEIKRLDGKLAEAGAGLIEPTRMVQVVREVLTHQQGLVLISLRNQAVRPLVPATDGTPEGGPYVHPVELVVEGDFFSVLSYLRALESLPWQLHWQALELQTDTYPLNRVRIELSTLGMERAWLGV